MTCQPSWEAFSNAHVDFELRKRKVAENTDSEARGSVQLFSILGTFRTFRGTHFMVTRSDSKPVSVLLIRLGRVDTGRAYVVPLASNRSARLRSLMRSQSL